MNLAKLGRTVAGSLDFLSRKLAWVSAAMIMVVFAVVVIDVVGRYVFNHPLKGSNDIGELLLIPIAFCAMPFTQVVKDHVRVTLIYAKLSPKAQSIVDALVFLMGAGVWGLITWNMARRASQMIASTYSSDSSSAVLRIPHLPFVLVIVVGGLLFCLVLLADSVRAVAKARDLGKQLT